MKQQKGFTLIELVVVIVILGVLAAVALPRFMNATDDAHTAAVSGTGGALAAGVALVRSQWELNRNKGVLNPNDNVQGFGANDVDVNTSGWPVTVDSDANNNTLSPARCEQLWNALLQGAAPSVAQTGSVAAATADYAAAANGSVCDFTYRLDGRTTGQRTISYDAANGVVTTSAD